MKLIYRIIWILFCQAEVIVSAQQHVDKVRFEYKILNKKECKNYFKTKKIIKKGYQPIQITVTNNSNDCIAVSQKGLNLQIVPADVVLNSLYKSGAIRGIALATVATSATVPMYMFMLVPPALWITSCVYFTTMFTAAMFTGFGARIYNQKINLIATLELQSQIIPPYTSVMGMVFVKSDSFTSDVTLTVENQNTQESLTLYPSF